MGKTAVKLERLRQEQGQRSKMQQDVLRGKLRAQPVQCCGVSASSTRCRSRTRFPNRYCARHQKQTSFDRHEWLVESANESYTNVSRPEASRAYVGSTYGETVHVGDKTAIQLPLPNAIAEQRAGALALEDLHFLS